MCDSPEVNHTQSAGSEDDLYGAVVWMVNQFSVPLLDCNIDRKITSMQCQTKTSNNATA